MAEPRRSALAERIAAGKADPITQAELDAIEQVRAVIRQNAANRNSKPTVPVGKKQPFIVRFASAIGWRP